MKRFSCLVMVLFLLTGCDGNGYLDKAMELRQNLIQSGCSFDAEITADYGDVQHQFSLHCQSDQQGDLNFSVLEPESIADITGIISASEGKLTFDDKAVAFTLMAEGQLSPVSGPWIMVKALRGGYLSSCCLEDDLYHLSIDDSHEAQSLGLEVWFNEDRQITYAEIYWKGRMLLSMEIENFVYV